MRCSICLLLCGISTSASFAGGRLDDATRRDVDERARRVEVEAVRESTQSGLGGATAWLVAETPLTAADEKRRLDVLHGEIVEHGAVLPPPMRLSRVMERLNEALPAHMHPGGRGFEVLLLADGEFTEAFTRGGHRIYVPSAVFDEFVGDESRAADDRLAFVLAREVAHVVRGHADRDARLARIGETAATDSRSMAGTGASLGVTAGVQHWLPGAVGPNDDREADLFALHLCRSAGFDLENALDFLRSRVSAERNVDDVATVRRLRRLRDLRREIDGPTADARYGLFTFDGEHDAWVPAGDRSVPGHVVLCVHGMESGPEIWNDLQRHLSRQPGDEEFTLLVYRYPNDGSLWSAGRGLTLEVARVVREPERIDFVSHSAGGLVTRVYTEVDSGAFRRAVFLATPHGGSDLAKLRVWLEVSHFAGSLRFGYSEALDAVLLDGRGQMSFDLRPGSLFLSSLDAAGAPDGPRARYTNVRGRRWNSAQGLGLRAGFAGARRLLSRGLRDRAVPRGAGFAGARRLLRRRIALTESRPATRDLALERIDRLALPAEVTGGDLAVSLGQARLEGCGRDVVLRLDHLRIVRDPAAWAVVDGALFEVASEATDE